MLICFALFDDAVSDSEKEAIVEAFHENEGGDSPPVWAQVILQQSILRLKLSDFASKSSLRFFKVTGVDDSLLSKPVSTWKTNEKFLAGLKIVTHIKSVNDCAERAVRLISKYLSGNQLTKNEEQRQYLMLVVAEDRKSIKLGA